MKRITQILATAILTLLFISSCKKEENNLENDKSGKSSTSTITDPRDGQTYKIVEIGSQTWFAENLRYGGSVQEATDGYSWTGTITNPNPLPAWCYYNNNSQNGDIYGKLYNWYAVNTGTLCPPGWHIPNDEEWMKLSDYLGGASVAGGKMKATSGWSGSNVGATNSSGFSALPGGIRNSDNGEFLFIGTAGTWWSTTDFLPEVASSFQLVNSFAKLKNPSDTKNEGYSCRCLKD